MTTDDRRLLLIAALAGGFGAVFGVPLAGAVFALEVQSIGRIRYEAFVPALAASLVGDLVMSGLGYEHHAREQFDVTLNAALVGKVAVAGLVFGLAGAAFAELTHAIKRVMASRVGWPPLRPVLGGVAIIGLAGLFGQDYLGLSLPLIDRALAGDQLSFCGVRVEDRVHGGHARLRLPGWGGDPAVRDWRDAGRRARLTARCRCGTFGGRRLCRRVCGGGEYPPCLHDHGGRVVRSWGCATVRGRLRGGLHTLRSPRHLLDPADRHR